MLRNAHSQQAPIALTGQEAIDLWLKGSDVWNKWVEENPEAYIHFFGADFEQLRRHSTDGVICFVSFNFPNGGVSFNEANFGDGDVSFSKANFGDGDVDFGEATFYGNVRFIGANFGAGNVSFKEANFGGGDVSFKEANFGGGYVSFKEANFGGGYVSFEEAIFGDGDVVFFHTNFGDGGVDFNGTTFGDGYMNFEYAIFGDGYVNFEESIFGDGAVGFFHTNFGDGDVDFNGTTFGDSDVFFKGTTFGHGNVVFSETTFGDGKVNFEGAIFGDGNVVFSEATFGDGNVSFFGADFGDGKVNFEGAIFGDGYVDFSGSTFGDGYVDFSGGTFGYGVVKFEKTTFKGHAILSNLQGLEKTTSFSLRHSAFEKSLDLSGNIFHCVPDLTSTKISHQVALDRIHIYVETRPSKHLLRRFLANLLVIVWGIRGYPAKYRSIHKLIPKTQWLSRYRAVNVKDIERVRRLKDISESNKDHALSLEFHVQEIKAKRWRQTTNKSALFTEFLFEKLSDYGRSEKRPIVALFSFWLFFALCYVFAATKKATRDNLYSVISEGLTFSFAQMLPLVPSSRGASTESAKVLFGDNIPNWIYLFTGTQSIIAIVLIFLLGLALRNRFRI